MQTPRTREILIVGSAGIALVALLGFDEVRSRKAARPGEGATNLISFLESRTDIAKIREFTKEDRLYIEVFAKYPPSLLKLRSGPPTYVFDQSGKMVDWTADRGDAPGFVSRWGNLSNVTIITKETAKHLLSTNNNLVLP